MPRKARLAGINLYYKIVLICLSLITFVQLLEVGSHADRLKTHCTNCRFSVHCSPLNSTASQ